MLICRQLAASDIYDNQNLFADESLQLMQGSSQDSLPMLSKVPQLQKNDNKILKTIGSTPSVGEIAKLSCRALSQMFRTATCI